MAIYFKDGEWCSNNRFWFANREREWVKELNRKLRKFDIRFYRLFANRYLTLYSNMNRIEQPEEYQEAVEKIADEMFEFVFTKIFEKKKILLKKHKFATTPEEYINLIKSKDKDYFEYSQHSGLSYDLYFLIKEYINKLHSHKNIRQ